MREANTTKTRHMREVHPITIEVDDSIYQRLVAFCCKFDRSKRWIVEDALTCWLNQRDMEAQAKSKESTGV